MYVAFVVDAFARRIVGWRVSRSAQAGFVLDALEQALHERRPVEGDGLVHHSDRGVQYLALRYTDRLAEAGVEPSVGSVGDSYYNALAETIDGLFKAEVIHRCGPWRTLEAVEYATLEWVDWYNHRRLLEPIGNVPPAEAEAAYHAGLEATPMAAKKSSKPASEKPGAVHWSWTPWRWLWASGGPKNVIPSRRSGIAVHVSGVRQALQGSGRAAVHGLGRRRIRQRHVRKLFRDARVRAAGASPVHVPGRSAHGLLQLHRGLVQPGPLALGARLPSPMAYEAAAEAATAEP